MLNLVYAMGNLGGGGGATGGDFSFIIILVVVGLFLWAVIRIKKNRSLRSMEGRVISEKHTPQYGAAKAVGRLTTLVGFAVLVLGIVGCIISIGIISSLSTARGLDTAQQIFKVAAIAGAVFSLQFALIGLLLAGMGQHFRATIDNANHSGEMLALMKAGVATPPLVAATRVQQQVSTGKFCSECGAAVVDVESAFCAQCGVKL